VQNRQEENMKYIVSIIIFLLFVSPSMADEVIVAWDANIEPDLAGHQKV